VIVALDMQLAVGNATGIGEYVRGLAPALRECGVDVVELSEPKLDPWRFDRRVTWDQIVLPQRARSSGADLLHCASGTMPLRATMPAVVTVHDVAWLKVQSHTRPYARYYFGTFALQRYPHAAAIVVDSKFSRNELLSVLDVPGERVHVVYPGVARDYCALERRPSGERTILVPGTIERRKNLEVLIRALRSLPPDTRLICVGPSTPYKEECERVAAEAGVLERLSAADTWNARSCCTFTRRARSLPYPRATKGSATPPPRRSARVHRSSSRMRHRCPRWSPAALPLRPLTTKSNGVTRFSQFSRTRMLPTRARRRAVPKPSSASHGVRARAQCAGCMKPRFEEHGRRQYG